MSGIVKGVGCRLAWRIVVVFIIYRYGYKLEVILSEYLFF